MEKEAKKLFKKTKETLNKAKRSYVCKTLKDVIRGFRDCKTTAEERALVKKECAHIRDLFNEGDTAFRRRNVLKLLFFHMNGYPTDFGQIECLKLCASHKYMDKRVGYLGMMVLLTETEETLMLITNCLKLDLESNYPTVVALALTALGDVTSTEMLRDLEGAVQNHIVSRTPFVRKKAALAATQTVRKLPEMAELFVGKVSGLLEQKVTAVVLSGLALGIEIAIQAPTLIPDLRRTCSSQLVRVMQDTLAQTYDTVVIGGVPEPFLQGRVLTLMRFLGKDDGALSTQFGEILAQVAASTDTSKAAGNAVTYECVKTLITLPVEPSLKTLALRILEGFLEKKESNLRYVALQELNRVVVYDTVGVQALQNTILDCLKEEDVSIRRRAVDLVFGMTDQRNVTTLVRELVSFISTCQEKDLQEDAARKVGSICMSLSPSHEWHVDIMSEVLVHAGNNMPEELCTELVALVSSEQSVQGYAAITFYDKGIAPEPCHDLRRANLRLQRTALLIFGEYGHLVVGPARKMRFADACGKIKAVLKACTSFQPGDGEDEFQDEIDRVCENALSGLVTLGARVATETDVLELRHILADFRASHNIELQQRACEYSILLAPDMADVRAEVCAPLPPMDYKAFRNRQERSVGRDSATVQSMADPLNLFDLGTVPNSTTRGDAAPGKPSSLTALDDLLGSLSFSGQPRREESLLAIEAPPSQLSTASSPLALPSGSSVPALPAAPAKSDSRALPDFLSLTDSSLPRDSASQDNGMMEEAPGFWNTVQSKATHVPDQPPSVPDAFADLVDPLQEVARQRNSTPSMASSTGGISEFFGLSAGSSETTRGPQPSRVSLNTSSGTDPGRQTAEKTVENRSLPMIFEKTSMKDPVLLNGEHVIVTLRIQPKTPNNQQLVEALAVFENKTNTPLSQCLLQLAVPKYISLKIQPASSSVIPPAGSSGGSVTQKIELTNSMAGIKPVQLKYKINYQLQGKPVEVLGTMSIPE